MIWLFDDSLFLKSVSAPYVSNMRLARHMNALPLGFWERPVQFSNLEGGLACELRQAYCAVQKRIWLHQVHVQGNIFLLLCIQCSLSLFLSLFYYELTMLLRAVSAVFEYLGLSKPSRIKLWEASLSLFPLPSWGSILVIIIGTSVFSLAGILMQCFTIQTNFNQLYNLCLVTLNGSLVDPDDKPWQTVHTIAHSKLIELIFTS